MAYQIISPSELAARWGLATGTLANWRAQGLGPPFVKRGNAVNGRVSYPFDAAIRWGRKHGYET